MITVSMLLLRLQGPSIFFVTVYLIKILLAPSNLLLINKCIVRPIMEYACPVWFLHTTKNINYITCWSVFRTKLLVYSRWSSSSYCWSKSLDVCLKELKWPSIHQRHIYSSVCQVHDIFNFIIEIPFPFPIIFSSPMLPPDLIHSLFDLSHHQLTFSNIFINIIN